MKRWLSLILVVSSLAHADGINGWGQVGVGGGFRWVPNWWFQDHAAALGRPIVPTVDGGGQITATFGYGVSSLFSLNIDLIGGLTNFSLQNPGGDLENFTAVQGAGLIGVRMQGTDVFFKGFMPYLSVQAGPLFSSVQSQFVTNNEKLTVAVSASGGLTWKFTHQFGLTLEARYVYARAAVPDISGINVGGVSGSLLFSIFFPPSMKQELDVPGF